MRRSTTSRACLSSTTIYTYGIMGYGCCQEGISHESCAYAGHLGLGKLTVSFDDNGITIDGYTDLSFTEDVGKRYEAHGWQMLIVKDGNTDVDAIWKALTDAKACTDEPALIQVKTVIGHGSPKKADCQDAHGEPLGKYEGQVTRYQLGWKYKELEMMDHVYETHWEQGARGVKKKKKKDEWNKMG